MLVAEMVANDESVHFKKIFGKELLRRLAINYEQYLISKGLPPYAIWKSRLESLIEGILEFIVKDSPPSPKINPKKDRFTRKDYFTWASLEEDVMSFSEWLESVGLKNYLLQQLEVDELSDDLLDF